MIAEFAEQCCRSAARKLRGRSLMGTWLRIYCDGGLPIFRWIPAFHAIGYAPLWGMKGFWINWLGRQVFFSFGKDKRGLYG